MHQLREQERKLPEQEDQELKFQQHSETLLFIMIQQINGMLQVVEVEHHLDLLVLVVEVLVEVVLVPEKQEAHL